MPTEFDYSGQLRFNGVYEIQTQSEKYRNGGVQKAENELFADLPAFEEGSPLVPGDGYEKIPLRDDIRDSDEILSPEVRKIADSLTSYRYRKEKFAEEIVEIDGDEKVVNIRGENQVDIFCQFPEFAFFRGRKGLVPSVKEVTNGNLPEDIRLRQLRFEPDFLLWLFYRYKNDKPVMGDFSVEKFTDSETSSSSGKNYFGETNIVNDSMNLEKSPPLLLAILQGRKISMLEGQFNLQGKRIIAEISNSMVHVKAQGALEKNRDSVYRVAHALKFLHSISQLYQYWQNLEPAERYPPKSFFGEVFKECKEQGITISSIPEGLLREQASKRKEPADDWIEATP